MRPLHSLRGRVTLLVLSASGCVDLSLPAGQADGGADDLTNQLVGHWRFDERMGTTASDSARGADASLTGATWTTGRIGGAIDLGTDGDFLTVPHPTDGHLDFARGPFTVALWVKTMQVPGVVPAVILSKRSIDRTDV